MYRRTVFVENPVSSTICTRVRRLCRTVLPKYSFVSSAAGYAKASRQEARTPLVRPEMPAAKVSMDREDGQSCPGRNLVEAYAQRGLTLHQVSLCQLPFVLFCRPDTITG
jgi:hypothetical protein